MNSSILEKIKKMIKKINFPNKKLEVKNYEFY